MSHPAWDEWIEINQPDIKNRDSLSHPAWDEWIEISKSIAHLPVDQASHPAWDEWIEIPTNTCILPFDKSHPAWDEWIEISFLNGSDRYFVHGLIPLGMSGLKFVKL